MNKEEPIQGAVVSIVSNDSILFSKGYGLANIDTQTAFDPVKTNVMVASVSKLITTTAILQLIEQGKIALDQPVSELIGDVQIENPFDTPVLVKHVLTHTAGFDDYSIGSGARSFNELESLRAHLEKRLPPIVWEPGKYFNYSNLGMVLMSYVVENVSGTSYHDYLEKNVLSPLSMQNSGFAYEDKSIKNMMTRYKWKEDDNGNLFLDNSYGVKYTNQIGAGGFQTTANDMNHFMQMYLNNGLYNDTQILKSETIQEAFKPHFYYHELMNRKQGLGWKVGTSEGVNYVAHAGDDTAIESLVVLFPESNLGYFFASNNNEAFELKYKIRDFIVNQLKGKERNLTSSSHTSSSNLESLTGTYQYMNDGQASIERLFSYLFGDVYNVENNNGKLLIGGENYTEIDDLLFQRDEKNFLIKFLVDKKGSYFTSGYATYRKLSSIEKPSLHLNLLIACFLIFVLSLILWVIRYFKSKIISKPKLYFGLSIFSLTLFFALLAAMTSGGNPRYGLPPIFYLIFTFPIIGILFSTLGLSSTFKFYLNQSISLFNKLHMSLVILSIVICLMIFNYYNLIGYYF
ncbi:MAG: serine hydrolase [Bacteroidota bacterium]